MLLAGAPTPAANVGIQLPSEFPSTLVQLKGTGLPATFVLMNIIIAIMPYCVHQPAAHTLLPQASFCTGALGCLKDIGTLLNAAHVASGYRPYSMLMQSQTIS